MLTLALNIHTLIYKLRKGIILVLIALAISAAFAKKTEWRYGIEPKLNFANQLDYNPRDMENESYHWKQMKCFGVSTFLEMQKLRHWGFSTKLGYDQKGFIQNDETNFRVKNANGIETSLMHVPTNKNTFHYLSLDALAKYNFGRKLIIPFAEAGLRINYLLAKNMRSAELFRINSSPFYDYKFYKSLALGLIAGAGVSFYKKLSLAFETDLDLTRSVNTNDLVVKNWVNSITLGFNINELFKMH